MLNNLILSGGKKNLTSHFTCVVATTKEVTQISNMLFSFRAGPVFESSAVTAQLKEFL